MTPSDRLKAALVAFVRQLVARFDYAASYPCTVTAQNADGTLELQPDSAALPRGLSRVPIRYGLPGISVRVKSGARISLEFEAMDPGRPVATIWDEAEVELLNLDTSNPDPKPIARMGDSVTFAFPTPTPLGIPCTVIVMGLPGTLGPPGPIPGFVFIASAASGVIESGSRTLFA